jgi:hypothetical protein
MPNQFDLQESNELPDIDTLKKNMIKIQEFLAEPHPEWDVKIAKLSDDDNFYDVNLENIGNVAYYGIYFTKDGKKYTELPKDFGLLGKDPYEIVDDDEKMVGTGYFKWKLPSSKRSPNQSPKRTTKRSKEYLKGGTDSSVTSGQLRNWDSYSLARYMVNESSSPQDMVACLIGTLNKRLSADPNDEKSKLALNKLERLQTTATSPEFLGNMTSPKNESDSEDSDSEVKKPEDSEKMKKMKKYIDKYYEAVKNDEVERITRLSRTISILANKLGIGEDELGEKYDFFGFGQRGSRAYGRQFSKRKFSNRKKKTGKLHRTKKPKSRLRKTGKFSKPRFTSHRAPRKLGSMKKNFGSNSIYGLQNGPDYSGGYEYKPDFPNLDNVKRSFRAYGSIKRTKARKKFSNKGQKKIRKPTKKRLRSKTMTKNKRRSRPKFGAPQRQFVAPISKTMF